MKIRASSIPEFIDCPARWKSRYIDNCRLPISVAALLGSAVHAGTAAYDGAKIAGSPISIDDATEAVFRFTLICAPSPIFLPESVREGEVREVTN